MRKPSMSPESAIAAIGVPRGSLHLVGRYLPKAQYFPLRKWLSASGVPSSYVARMRVAEMVACYNDLSNQIIAEHKTRAMLHGLENPCDSPGNVGNDDDVDLDNAAVINGDVEPTPVPPQPAGDAATLLREIILGGWKPGIDENRVRAIVDEAITGVAPRVIEIRHGDDKPPIRIDGLVHPEFERALRYLQGGANVMLVGPAGCGKSHMINQLAKAMDVRHTIVGGTAGVTEGDLIGRLLPGDGGRFEYSPSMFVKLYEEGNAVIGLDEIDGFDPNMLMVANMPLSNGHMYVHIRRDNPYVMRGKNVYFVATANTFGTGSNPMYVGRNPMDEATRDRFIFISVDYDKRLEESIAAAGGLTAAEMAGIWELRDRCREAQLRRVISTRAFQKASIMKRCGDTWREIRDRLLEGWSKDEKSKVGV